MYLNQARQTARNLPTSLKGIPEGAAGIRVTLTEMAKLARAAARDPNFIQWVRSLVAGERPKDWMGEITRVHEFVRDQIRYIRDPVGMEWVQTPGATLKLGQGDCDDKSTLAAAMLNAIGHPARFVAVGFAPGHFSHVYVETRIYRKKGGAHWVGMDATEPWPVGQVPPGTVSRMIKDV